MAATHASKIFFFSVVMTTIILALGKIKKKKAAKIISSTKTFLFFIRFQRSTVARIEMKIGKKEKEKKKDN